MFEDADIPPSQVSEGIQEWQSLSSTQLEQLESWAEEEEGEGGEDQVSEQEAVKEVGTVEWERGICVLNLVLQARSSLPVFT